MTYCEKCGDEMMEARATMALAGTIIISELEQAIHNTPERRAALLDAKVENARQMLSQAWKERAAREHARL